MWRLVALVPALAGCDYVFSVRVPDPPDAPIDEPGCLFDDFNAGGFDAMKWIQPPSSPVKTSIAQNQIEFALPPTVDTLSGDLGYLQSTRLYDMTDGAFEAELVAPPDPAAKAYAGVALAADLKSVVEIFVGNGFIVGASYDSTHPAGEFTTGDFFDPAKHRVLRIVCTGATITFEARDASGATTFQQTLPARFPIAQLYVELIASTFQNTVDTQASLDNALVDGPNCANMQ
jgi:hypothetical protein